MNAQEIETKLIALFTSSSTVAVGDLHLDDGKLTYQGQPLSKVGDYVLLSLIKQFRLASESEIAYQELRPSPPDALTGAERADRAFRELEPGQPDKPPAAVSTAYDELAPEG